jgi:hypothetical protein
MPKPKGDLGALVIPKAAAAAARPFQAVAPAQELSPLPAAAAEQPAIAHQPEGQGTGQTPASLSASVQAPGAGATRAMTLKIPEAVYWRLHELCAARGRAQGRRVTHQEVMLEGLLSLLDRE